MKTIYSPQGLEDLKEEIFRCIDIANFEGALSDKGEENLKTAVDSVFQPLITEAKEYIKINNIGEETLRGFCSDPFGFDFEIGCPKTRNPYYD